MNKLNKEELIETIASLQFCRDNNYVSNDYNIMNNTNAIIKLRKQLKHLEDKEEQND